MHRIAVDLPSPVGNMKSLPRPMRLAMPEPLVMTIHAYLVGGLDGLPTIDAELDHPTDADAAAGDGVIAAGPVASFATAPLEIVARLDLEQPAHFGFGEFAREIL